MHFLHVMWLQREKGKGDTGQQPMTRGQRVGAKAHLHPPFFSIVLWHLVHSFVLALIQLLVSESSAHFFFHSLAILQMTGRWSTGSVQPKQKVWPQWQWTVGMIVLSCLAGACLHSIANSPVEGRWKGARRRSAEMHDLGLQKRRGRTHILDLGTIGGPGCRRRTFG